MRPFSLRSALLAVAVLSMIVASQTRAAPEKEPTKEPPPPTPYPLRNTVHTLIVRVDASTPNRTT